MKHNQNFLDVNSAKNDFDNLSINHYYSLLDDFGNYTSIKDTDPAFQLIKKAKKDKSGKNLKKTISQELEEISMERNRKISVPKNKSVLSSFLSKIDNVENLVEHKIAKDLKSDCICILEKMLNTYERKLGPDSKQTLQVKQKLMIEKESLI